MTGVVACDHARFASGKAMIRDARIR